MSRALALAVIDRVSPFHFVFGADFKILEIGPSLRRSCPGVHPGAALEVAFEVQHPVERLRFEKLAVDRRTFTTLRYRETGLTLRGEFVPDAAGDLAVFVGSPLLTRPEDLRAQGLVLGDLAISDATIDCLMLAQTKDIMIGDMSRLAGDLEHSRWELAETNLLLEERVRQQGRLLAVSEVLGGTFDETEGLRRVCRELALLVRADCAVAWILDPDRTVARARAGYHVPRGVRAPAELNVADLPFREAVLEQGKLLSTADAPNDHSMDFALFRSLPHQSCAVVPIQAEGRAVGAFQLIWWSARRPLSAKDEELLLAVGRQAGMLLRAARLVETLSKRADRLRLLTELQALVSSSLDLDRVLEGVVQSAASLMGVQNAKFWFATPDGAALTLAACYGERYAEDVPEQTLPVREGGVGETARRRELVVVPDVFAEGSPMVHRDWWRRHGLSSFVGIPVTSGETLVGVLTLEASAPSVIGEEERVLLTAVASQAAAATRNARLYEQAEAARQAAEQAARVKDEFLATMSHELRTPLNAILGLSEALQEEVLGPLTPAQHKATVTVKSSGEHLLALINDILDLARIASGAKPLDTEAFETGRLVDAAVGMISSAAAARGIAVEVTIAPGCETVVADERRLKQILINLLSNATKFTPNGGRIGVEVEREPGSAGIRFTVWDTGIGIALADQHRLFQPFAQLDSELHRRYPGAGLGLALSRRLAELHGGTIEVESDVGRGARFSVTLPQPAAAPEVHRDEPAGEDSAGRRQ